MSEAAAPAEDETTRWTQAIVHAINNAVTPLEPALRRQVLGSLARSLTRAAMEHVSDPVDLLQVLSTDIAEILTTRGIATEICFEAPDRALH